MLGFDSVRMPYVLKQVINCPEQMVNHIMCMVTIRPTSCRGGLGRWTGG